MQLRKLTFIIVCCVILLGCTTKQNVTYDIKNNTEQKVELQPLQNDVAQTEDNFEYYVITAPTVEPETPIIEDKDITFTIEFFNEKKDMMPYFLYTPSTREISSEPIPLIIWLHGADDYYCKYENMSKRGLPAALENWGELDKFDAYILCPQMTGKWHDCGGWQTEPNRKNLDNILAEVLANNPIDTERIIIAGHSIGGRGAITNAFHNMNDFEYYKVCAISGFVEDYDLRFWKELDIRFYTGKIATGETKGVYYHNVQKMTKYFGEENLFFVDGSHATSPVKAFLLDEDHNNKSDLIEWMLSDKKL